VKRAFALLLIVFAFALARGEETAPPTSPGDVPVTSPGDVSEISSEVTPATSPAGSPALATSPAEVEVTVNETGVPLEEEVAEEEVPSCMGGGGIMSFLPMIAIIVIFYFLMIRPQQKQAKQMRAMREAFQMNDRVITAGGIHGHITNIKSDIITVKIADSVKIDVDRNSLTLEINPGESTSTSR